MKIVLDIETTGLPTVNGFNSYKDPKLIKNYDSSRVVQIAIGVYDNKQNEKEFYNILINPENKFYINNYKFHGITQEKASKEGIIFKKFIPIFEKILLNTDLIIGHNINFDVNVLASELYRNNEQNLAKMFLNIKRYCTCFNGKNIVKIKNKKNNNYKLPKLNELYQFFFNEEMKNYHDAKYDVIHTAKCYFKMIEN